MKTIITTLLVALSCAFSFSQTTFIFDTPGASSFVVPAGCHTRITVEVYGGGGGGGGANDPTIGGGGGGGGGYAKSIFNANPGDVFNYVVGSGGVGGAPGFNGGNGGQSNFDGGTLRAFGGTRGFGENNGGAGGTGGTGSGWAANVTGGTGGNGIDPNGGAGGATGGIYGGASVPGGAAGVNGTAGPNYGAGGSGGGKTFGSNTSGGAGSNGAVIITLGGVYTSVASGNWNTNANWDVNIAPGNEVSCGDFVIINHTITLNGTKNILGTMTVNASGTIQGAGRDILVGDGEANMGRVNNYGLITNVDDFDAEPDDCTVPGTWDSLPAIYNYSGGIVDVNKMDIGDNPCGSGSLYNLLGGKIYMNSFHLDALICNEDSIFVAGNSLNHGGTIDCCGYMETDGFEFTELEGRMGTTLCQEYCTSLGLAPIMEIDGTNYQPPVFLTSPDPSEAYVGDSTTFCSLVNLNSLPVELWKFEARAEDDREVILTWTTASEYNNDKFTILRSRDGKEWRAIGMVQGAGTTLEETNYTYHDHSPYLGVSYYLLKQTDFDGEIEFSQMRSVSVGLNGEVAVYPNPTKGEVYLESSSSQLEFIQVYDMIGKNVTNATLIEQLSSSVFKLDLTDLTPGIYTIKDSNSSHRVSKL